MINLAENIRAYRKERKMTQEQLAEVLGVTLGAVSKWELGASTPDLGLIIEMAGFFETSVDYLLGYEWHSDSVQQTIDHIRSLRNEKRFEEASSEAEKALQKYPNNFDIAYHSANQYLMRGVEYQCRKSYQRSLELYERSLELIGQNTDKSISEWTLKNHIARVYLCLGQNDKALEQMKNNNVDGLNDGYIGYTLANALHQPDEALKYLSDALIDHVVKIFIMVTAYANAYCEKKEYSSAMEILLWMQDMLKGLEQPGFSSYLEKAKAQLLTTCAIVSALDGEKDLARKYLNLAAEAARKFDANPQYGFAGIRFYHCEKDHTAFDSFGKTAMAGIRQALEEKKEASELLAIWEQITAD